ncbi:protein kinase [Amycolatopsis sp. NPDC059021]|uniref:serine/threonine-protein kinase n=1 Tax=Amycolatopsis sp. NPDC059021 TaxID=3346704 RepID=UPI00366D3C2C
MIEGQVFAHRYELVERIGEGGMGEVWRAIDRELRRDVAVKRASAGDVDQVRHEARVGAGVQHPNVVTVFDVIEDGDERLLVMEYFSSRDLADLLDTEGVLPPRRVAAIGAQVATALAAMHAKGIVHRDIKPGNVLVAEDGTTKLTDLGIATWRDRTLTGCDQVGGTPSYMAPEVTAGKAATSASDVFSLGATLFVAVEGTSHQEATAARRAGRLDPVISALLEPDPSKRPTVGQARKMLLRATGSAWRRPVPRASAMVAGVAVLCLVGWQLWPSPQGQPVPAPVTPSLGSRMGDERTADPCALADPHVLDRFGLTELDTDRGGLNRCDLFLRLSDQDLDEVYVQVELQRPDPDTAAGPAPAVSPVRIDRPPLAGGKCRRIMRLADQSRVVLTAKHSADKPVDLCAMTDAVTDRAASLLGDGEVPRRTRLIGPPAAVFQLDPCSLLDTSDVAGALGGVQQPKRGFGGWECRWDNAEAGWVSIVYDRSRLLTSPHDGQQVILHGHDTWIETNGDGNGSCLANIVQQHYADLDEPDRAKVVLVAVAFHGNKPGEQLCRPVTALASTVAERLLPR